MGDLENAPAKSIIILLNGNHRRLSSRQAISREAASAYSDFTSPDPKNAAFPRLRVSSSTSRRTMIALSCRTNVLRSSSKKVSGARALWRRSKQMEIGQTRADPNSSIARRSTCGFKILNADITSNILFVCTQTARRCNLFVYNWKNGNAREHRKRISRASRIAILERDI